MLNIASEIYMESGFANQPKRTFNETAVQERGLPTFKDL